MVLNNGFVLLMWFMFFAGFRSVRGWQLADMALQIGLIAVTFGAAGVFAGGYRDMAAVILRGDLDRLADAAARGTAPIAGPGECGAGLGRHRRRRRVAGIRGIAALGAICQRCCSCWAGDFIVFLATGILFASLAFWVRGARSFARDLVEFLLTFGTWPGSIWSGATKVIVYTIVPGGFRRGAAGAVPATPTMAEGLLVAAAALAYATGAAGVPVRPATVSAVRGCRSLRSSSPRGCRAGVHDSL